MASGSRKKRTPFSAGLGYNARNVWSGDKPTPHPEEQMSGLFLGQVMDDFDEQKMGRIWVYIPTGSTKRFDEQSLPTYGGTAPDKENDPTGYDERLRNGWILVSPLLPYYGTDEYRGSSSPDGRNSFSGSINSYGMWFQPRIGDYVGVLFANGDPNNGFWIGMPMKAFSNSMVPGIPGEKAENIQGSQGDAILDSAPGDARLPVMSRAASKEDPNRADVAPASDLARSQVLSGVSGDIARGAGNSGARRESPSYTMGIKSPGWSFDSEKGNRNEDGSKFSEHSERYFDKNSIGHQFIMDDHPDYQGMRLRTSEGSQILMHDACHNPFIYIQTASGDAWIEIANSGDISIYSKGGIHVHTEGDYNLTVDGNMNVDVRGHTHWRTGGNHAVGVAGIATYAYSDNVSVSVEGQFDQYIGDDARMTYGGDADTVVGGDAAKAVFGSEDKSVSQNFNQRTGGTHGLSVGGDSHKKTEGKENVAVGEYALMSEGAATIESGGFTLQANAAATIYSSEDLDIKTGSNIQLNRNKNSPDVAAPEETPPLNAAVRARTSDLPPLYSTPTSPNRMEIIQNQSLGSQSTVAPVVPQHQPWSLRCGLGATPGTNGLVSSSAIEGGIVPPSDNTSCNRFDNPQNMRNGASIANAALPEQVVGGTTSLQGQVPVISDGMGYRTDSKAERPVYRSVRLASEGETHTPDSLSLSDEGLKKIKMRETFIQRPIRDPFGENYVVGYGHKVKFGDTIGGTYLNSETLASINRLDNDREKTLQITKDEAESFLEREVLETEAWLRKTFPEVEFTQDQWDAVVSFTRNVTPEVLERDKAGKEWIEAIREGNFEEAKSKMLSFSYVGGAVDCNMLDRRRAESRDFGSFSDRDGVLGQSVGFVPAANIHRVAGFEINPDVFEAICGAERSYADIPDGYFFMIAAQESAFNPYAKARNSTAAGLFLIPSEVGVKYGVSRDRGMNSNAYDPSANATAFGKIIDSQRETLTAYGTPSPTATDLYMAHFLGEGRVENEFSGAEENLAIEDNRTKEKERKNGAIRFLEELRDNPDGLPSEEPVFRTAVSDNPSIFYHRGESSSPRTYQEVYAIMEQKVNKRITPFASVCEFPPPLVPSMSFNWTTGTNTPNFERIDPRIRAIVEKSALEANINELQFNSGYRSPRRNYASGGARKSQHLIGNAIDIGVGDLSIDQRRAFIERLIQNGATGIGVGNTLIHADIRDSAPQTWTYSGTRNYAGDILRKHGYRGA